MWEEGGGGGGWYYRLVYFKVQTVVSQVLCASLLVATQLGEQDKLVRPTPLGCRRHGAQLSHPQPGRGLCEGTVEVQVVGVGLLVTKDHSDVVLQGPSEVVVVLPARHVNVDCEVGSQSLLPPVGENPQAELVPGGGGVEGIAVPASPLLPLQVEVAHLDEDGEERFGPARVHVPLQVPDHGLRGDSGGRRRGHVLRGGRATQPLAFLLHGPECASQRFYVSLARVERPLHFDHRVQQNQQVAVLGRREVFPQVPSGHHRFAPHLRETAGHLRERTGPQVSGQVLLDQTRSCRRRRRRRIASVRARHGSLRTHLLVRVGDESVRPFHVAVATARASQGAVGLQVTGELAPDQYLLAAGGTFGEAVRAVLYHVGAVRPEDTRPPAAVVPVLAVDEHVEHGPLLAGVPCRCERGGPAQGAGERGLSARAEARGTEVVSAAVGHLGLLEDVRPAHGAAVSRVLRVDRGAAEPAVCHMFFHVMNKLY